MSRKHDEIERGTVGEALRGRRRALGWTQEELSRASGIPITTISKIERGEQPHPRTATLRALSAPMHTTAADLLREPVVDADIDAVLRELQASGMAPDDLTEAEMEEVRSFDLWRRKKPTPRAVLFVIQALRELHS